MTMKQIRTLSPVFLLISLACGLMSTAVPHPATPPGAIPSQTSFVTVAASPSQGPTEQSVSSPAPVTEAEPAASPQPAVRHRQPGDEVILDNLTMIDASNGWAVSGADVLFTADGARTWREATPPESISGSVAQAQGYFLDVEHAWIVYSFDRQIPAQAVVWQTQDGGRSWTASNPLNHEAYGDLVWAEFVALDADHVWLMMRGMYAGAGIHYAAQFFRSEDGGLNWLAIPGDVGVDYTGLVFADPEHGLLTWQTTGAYAPSPPEYALTLNGGDSWEVRQLPPPLDAPKVFETLDYCEPFQPHMFSPASIRLLVGCFDFHDPPQTFSSYLYASEDGGVTWTSVRLPEKVLASQDTSFYFDRLNVLLLGRDIYRSGDGGQNWNQVKSVTWDGQFSFVDPQTGWAIARANNQIALVSTTNGGTSWNELQPVIAP